MEKIDTEYFKEKLLKEKECLVEELKTVGRINPDNSKDWEAVPGEQGNDPADRNDYADHLEQFEENSAILNRLETEFNEVIAALERIDKGTYGLCEETKEQISRERLEAYPAARTCNPTNSK